MIQVLVLYDGVGFKFDIFSDISNYFLPQGCFLMLNLKPTL